MHLMHGSKDNVTMGTAAFGAITMDNMMAIAKFAIGGYGSTAKCNAISTASLNLKTGVLTPGSAGTITLNGASDSYYMALIPSSSMQTLTFTSSTGTDPVVLSRKIDAGKLYTQGGSAITVSLGPVETDEWINFNDPDMEVTGLPIWAKYNLGVDKSNLDHAYDWYGDYYAWGELIPYATQTWTDATTVATTTWNTTTQLGGGGYVNSSAGYAWQSYCNSSSSFVEWNVSPCTGSVPYNTTTNILLESRDIARQSWGGSWRMPTYTYGSSGELQQLKDNTLFVWTTSYRGISDLNGYVVYKVKATAHKGKCVTTTGGSGYTGYSGYTYALTDPHMFLPAAGFYSNGTDFHGAGTYGNYWSSSLKSSDTVWHMYFNPVKVIELVSSSRCNGYSVRPVR